MPLSDRLRALIRNPETPAFVLRDACAEEEPPVATVYVVVGVSWEYESHSEWNVAAYLEGAQAVACCEKLNAWCKEHESRPGRTRFSRDVIYDGKCPFDEGFHNCGHGVHYSVTEIPLRVGEGE